MNTSKKLYLLFLVATLGCIAVSAQEKKISRSDLPPAVEKTVSAETNGATIRGFSTEIENGKRIYEAELTVNGHGKDISMDAAGNIIEVEEEVPMAALRAEVQDGLKKAAGAGTITRIESLTKNGKLVAYEAAVRNGAKRSEIQVGPDGKPLAHPE